MKMNAMQPSVRTGVTSVFMGNHCQETTLLSILAFKLNGHGPKINFGSL